MLKKHRKEAKAVVNCAIITVSDTRNKETDKSGQLIQAMLKDTGHIVLDYWISPDEQVLIEDCLKKALVNPKIDAIIINGGTGIAKRDVTIESVEPFFDKELPGFGEIFRYLSYTKDIGSASIMSRATAGIANNTAIFSIPGSSGAVKLALQELIIPELGHIIMELKKDLNK
ncbi:MogA/MoaB family molybdenum cofactor biosynthesis protein [Aquibacillus salsiterrae]|uniref:Molybdenum cofactor biosynthesis protein B n=1 Tax=Aquibacillus salsiterrae TaxID=2950439 RepID=A0A9X3WDU2_9BACI|nr:MogA/MoaB family molybdenum cofactor biosynthesis protein [Aquibacillus salsiterrae]MDC3417852.1 MogA/MoaB family molybdenum cofactor biosynthesis protein [Aquibacillus salsiterrae]